MHLLISFPTGIVVSMIATREREGPFGNYEAEATARCKNMQSSANILDAATYQIVGRVNHQGLYVPEKTDGQ